MPACAIIGDKIICMHGGLSPSLKSMEQIYNIVRPVEIPTTGILCDLVWSDPQKNLSGWTESERGISYVFGEDVMENFLKKHDFDLVCRAHQVDCW